MGRFCLLSDIRMSRGQGLAKLENHSLCGYKLQNDDAGGEAAGVLKPFSVVEGRVLTLCLGGHFRFLKVIVFMYVSE